MTELQRIFIETATVAVGTIIIYVYLNSFFEFSTTKGFRICTYAAFFVLFAIVSVNTQNPILLISFTLISVMMLSIILYKGNLPRRIFSVVLFCGLMAVSEIACGAIITFLTRIEFETTRNLSGEWVLGIAMSKSVQMLIVKLIGFYVQRERAYSYVSIKWTCPLFLAQLFLIQLTYYVLVTAYLSSDVLSPLTLIMTLGILLLNIVLFWYFDSITAMLEYKHQNKTNELLLDQQIKYYALLEQKHSDMLSYKHDIDKHLGVIREMKRSAEIFEVREYITELENTYNKPSIIVRTSHSTISAVLSSNLERCSRLGIKTSMDIRLPMDIPISPIELCIVIGNIFENAIEACEMISETANRHISLTICKYNKALLIEMVNAYDIGKKKAKPGIRGTGLKNVWNVVNKNDGDMYYETKGGLFSISIFL